MTQTIPITSPWSVSAKDERRFDKIVIGVIAVFVLAGLLIPFIHVPEIKREQVEKVPQRFAKLLIEKKKEPPPEPEKKEEEKKEEKKEEKPKKDIEAARKKARKSGLLAMQDSLADLRDKSAISNLSANKNPLLGKQDKQNKQGTSLIASNLTKGSGGINTSHFRRDVGNVALAGRTEAEIESPVLIDFADENEDSDRIPSRTNEEIALVFEKYKGAIFSIYNRELRRNPSLQGKVVLKLTIEPSGKVSSVIIVSNEVKSKTFESKLAARVKLFNFGEKEAEKVVVTYTYDFLPS